MVDDFAYFTIRVRLAAASESGPTISGIIEDLATREKHDLGRSDELLVRRMVVATFLAWIRQPTEGNRSRQLAIPEFKA